MAANDPRSARVLDKRGNGFPLSQAARTNAMIAEKAPCAASERCGADFTAAQCGRGGDAGAELLMTTTKHVRLISGAEGGLVEKVAKRIAVSGLTDRRSIQHLRGCG